MRCFEGGRPGADLPAAGVRAVPEASGWRSSHGLHETEATRHNAGRLQRRTSAYSAWPGSHSTRRQQMQAHLSTRVRHTLRRLYQLQVWAYHLHKMHCIVIAINNCEP